MGPAPRLEARVGVVLFVLVGLSCGDEGSVASLPVAVAGFDRVVAVGTEVRLDGGESFDPSGKSVTFRWVLSSRPPASQAPLVASETAQPRLVPDLEGTYVIELVVSNGQRSSAPDILAVRATGGSTTNRPPVVVVGCQGGNCTVAHGSGQLTLVGNQTTDPNDPVNTLTFAWSQVTTACATLCPGIVSCTPLSAAVTWNTATTVQNPSFTAPDAVGTLVFRLEVTDPGALSDAECLEVETTNTPPVVSILSPYTRTIAEGEVIVLDGSNSGDSEAVDATRLTYAWSPAPSAEVIYAPSATAAAVVARAGGSLVGTTVEFKLAVSDPFSTTNSCAASCAAPCCVAVQITDVDEPAGATCYFDSECQSGNCNEVANQCL